MAGAACAAVLAVAALLPAGFTGHAAAAGNHQLASSATLLHIVAAIVWAGGLTALLIARRRLPPAALLVAVRRFSTTAVWCLCVVAVSGLAAAAARLPDPTALVTTRYGHLVLAKTAAITALALLGAAYRRRALPELAAGRPRAFLRLAAAEVVLFAATFGLAVALGRTPTPAAGSGEDAVALLGYPMPAPLTMARLVGGWLIEPLFAAAALAMAGLYLAAVWRLTRRGDSWPATRTAAWLTGCAVLLVVTSSGVARYGPVLFSVHMVQHMSMTMLVPILLVLGGPATLALRALRPATDPAWPGPREWLTALLHARTTRLIAHPLVALTVYVGSLYGLYFSGLYELALRSHAAHLAMYGHFVAAGYLFFWILIGVDRPPHPLPYPMRLPLLLAAMALHAFFGLAMMQTTTVLAGDWYTTLARPWGPTALEDQRIGGGLAWAFGELPALAVALALLTQWIRADEREQRRHDRTAGRDDDAHAAYNQYLAQLAETDRAAGRR